MNALPAQVGEDLVWAEAFAAPRRAPALFLDRDGVIVEEVNYLHQVEKTQLIAGAAEAINRAHRLGLHVVVVTNQSGIGRDLFDWPEFAAVQEKMLADLAVLGANVDAVMASPFIDGGRPPYGHPDHPARKPNPGMLVAAAALLDIDLASSWIVGDRAGDIEAGRRAGLAGGLHVLSGYGRHDRIEALALAQSGFPVLVADSLAEAPELIPILS